MEIESQSFLITRDHQTIPDTCETTHTQNKSFHVSNELLIFTPISIANQLVLFPLYGSFKTLFLGDKVVK